MDEPKIHRCLMCNTDVPQGSHHICKKIGDHYMGCPNRHLHPIWCDYCKNHSKFLEILEKEDKTMAYTTHFKNCPTGFLPPDTCAWCKHETHDGNKIPEGQGKRDKIRPRHDLIPIEFLDELAEIFEEGRKSRPGLPEGYGDSWKTGGEDFLRDCLNHASNHLHLYMNGNREENHLSKVAWNCLVVRYFKLKEKEIQK